jgi:sporulation protein YabP
MQETNFSSEKLLLENKKRLSMTGVSNVDGFSEQSLKITVKSEKVIINGENIKITSYNKDTGALIAEGDFHEIKYSFKKQPILKKLFK